MAGFYYKKLDIYCQFINYCIGSNVKFMQIRNKVTNVNKNYFAI